MTSALREIELLMTETVKQQRTRILLNSPQTSVHDYDSALALGYKPESWDGMWKLPADWPVIWLTRNWAIVREVVYVNGTNIPQLNRRRNGARISLHLRRRKENYDD